MEGERVCWWLSVYDSEVSISPLRTHIDILEKIWRNIKMSWIWIILHETQNFSVFIFLLANTKSTLKQWFLRLSSLWNTQAGIYIYTHIYEHTTSHTRYPKVFLLHEDRCGYMYFLRQCHLSHHFFYTKGRMLQHKSNIIHSLIEITQKTLYF